MFASTQIKFWSYTGQTIESANYWLHFKKTEHFAGNL